MPDITAHNSRDLDYVGEVKVRFIESDGTVNTYTKTELLANTSKQTEICTAMGIAAATESQVPLDYAKSGNDVLDEDDNVYTTTWKTGKAIKYAETDYNSNIFLDVTV